MGMGLLMFWTLIPFVTIHSNPFIGYSSTLLLQTQEFENACRAFLFSSFPMLLDVGLDMFSREGSVKNSDNYVLIGRAIYALTTFVFGLLLTYTRNDTNFWLLLISYRFLFLSNLFYFITATNPVKNTSKTTLAVNMFVTTFIHIAELMAATKLVFVLMLLGCIQIIKHSFQTKNLLQHNYKHVIYLNLLIMSAVIRLLLRMVFMYFSSSNYDSLNVVTQIYYFAIITIFLTIIPGRVARHDAITSKDHIIATKAAYERYISHELRTPLNTVDMGIDYCLTKIPENTTNEDEKLIRDTLIEVSLACDVSVEILDEFLLYDKLENGLVKLHKEEVNIGVFVSRSVAMFAAQIRAKNIQLQLINTDMNSNNIKNEIILNSSSISQMKFQKFSSKAIKTEELVDEENRQIIGECVESTDFVHIDKSKMSQVIRNLMSNAIKFTPKGSKIKVTIRFIQKNDEITQPLVGESNPEKKSNSDFSSFFIAKSNSGSVDDVGADTDASIANSLSPNLSTTKLDTKEKNTNIDYTLVNSNDHEMDETVKSGMLVIEVQDTGAGISVGNQTLLFKEIVQFNPEKLQAGGGSGLGLWISKDIVDMHGGRLNVYSDGEGKGTTFRLEIPMTRTDNHFISSPESSENIKSDNELRVPQEVRVVPKKNLLLVDDTATNRKMLRKLLEQRGHSCDEAEDGEEAVSMVKKAGLDYYDVILMDFMMPKMNGPDATRAIRQLGYERPIIGVTGNALDEDKSVFSNAGATQVIIKPLKIKVLQKYVDV